MAPQSVPDGDRENEGRMDGPMNTEADTRYDGLHTMMCLNKPVVHIQRRVDKWRVVSRVGD